MRAISLTWLLRVAEDAGLPMEDVFRGEEIGWDDLQHNRDVDIWCFARLLHRVAMLAPDGFGHTCGEQLVTEKLGLVGLAMLTSESLRQSTEIWGKYGELSNFPLYGTVQFLQDRWIYNMRPLFPTTERVWHFCIDILIECLATQSKQLSGRALYYQIVQLPFSHKRVTNSATSIRLGTEAQLIGSLADLDVVNRFADPAVCNVLIAQCERDMAELRLQASVRERVICELAQSRGTLPRLPEVARSLGMSARTLQRSIAAEGYSYQDLVNEYRVGLYQLLTSEGDCQPKRLTHQLGYSHPNSLVRLRAQKSAAVT